MVGITASSKAMFKALDWYVFKVVIKHSHPIS